MKNILVVTLAVLMQFGAARAELDDVRLTDEQKALQADVEQSLVAPCCWNMTVDHHDSPASREVRAKITELVKAGMTKQQILDYFSSQPRYGERILATPSQKTLLGKSAYWFIPLALIFGAFVVVRSIKSWTEKEKKNSRAATSTATGENATKPDDSTETSWARKVEDDLKNLDA